MSKGSRKTSRRKTSRRKISTRKTSTRKTYSSESCCKKNLQNTTCIRKKDSKSFTLPRKFTRKQCKKMLKKAKTYKKMGFTARSSCAPYKFCLKGGSENSEESRISGVAVLHQNDKGVSGSVHFIEQSGNILLIKYKLEGLKDGKHGFHIHEYGDLQEGCKSACAHYNPYNKTHGGLDSEVRHLGDLGNIESNGGISEGEIMAPDISITGRNSILGRMIIVHEDEDDCGNGTGEKAKESKNTGNAGARLACGVIGRGTGCS